MGKSSVSVKHVGKDFSYSIEETHGLGIEASSVVQQPGPIVPENVPLVPAVKYPMQESMPVDPPKADPSQEQVQDKFIDFQAMADQTVQIVPEFVNSDPSVLQRNPVVPVEPQVKSMPMVEGKMGFMFEPRLKVVEPENKDVANVPVIPQGKEYILFNPHLKELMGKLEVKTSQIRGADQLNVINPSFRMNHGFQYYQPIGYYYPVGMVRLV